MLSHVQNQILTQLLRDEYSTYTEIIPSGVDHNLFNYHLKFLLTRGYVLKNDDSKKYLLSDLGKKYVQQLDVFGNVKQYFKFSVLCYLTSVEDSIKKILMHERKRHPYYGDTATVSGKVHYGESVEDSASRKLKEETGLICNDFKLFGVHRKMRFDSAEKLIEDTLYHCCIGKEFSGELISENEFGKNFWVNFDEAKEIENKNKTHSALTQEVYSKIESGNFDFFYFQEKIKLDTF